MPLMLTPSKMKHCFSRKPSPLMRAGASVTLLLVIVFQLSFLPNWAEGPVIERETPKETSQQTKPKLSSQWSRMVQTMTGFSPFFSWFVTHLTEQQLKKKIQGSFKLHITPYSGLDLLKGNIAQMSLRGKNLLINQLLPVQSLWVETDKTTPIFITFKKPPHLLQPIQAQFKTVLTEENINQGLQTPKGKEKLKHLKVKLPPIGDQTFDVIDPQVHLLEGAFHFTGTLNVSGAPLENAVPLEAQGQLSPSESKEALELKNLHLTSTAVSNLKPMAQFIQQYFGKIVKFSRLKLKGHQVKIQVEKCELHPQQLILEGTIRLTPNPPPS
jgi:hypothetical protein